MKVEVTKDDTKSQASLAVSATAEEFAPYLEKAARTLTKDTAMPGFRPGKAPLAVVMESVGTERVVSAALEKAVPRWFVQALLDHDIEAIGRPATAIEEAGVDKGVRFTATVDVLPAVQVGEVKSIAVERRPATVTDKQVTQELTKLAKQRSTYLEVARPAQKGDTVTVDFAVSMDGAVMEGGESKNHPVHLGEGHFVPDFEQKLEGIAAGEEREFTISFPADFAQKKLAGKEATAKVKAHAVQKREIPKLDDEFAKSVGKFTSLQHLQEELKKNMGADLEQREEERVRGELAEKLAEVTTFGYIPTALIEREIDRRIEELGQMLSMQGKTIDDYLQQQKKKLEDVRKELAEPAERTVKVSLALREFAQQQDVEPTDEEIETKTQEYLARFATTEEAKKNINEEELKMSVTSTLRNQAALAKLEELATITEQKAPAKTE